MLAHQALEGYIGLGFGLGVRVRVRVRVRVTRLSKVI
jgi:hypothetical protein